MMVAAEHSFTWVIEMGVKMMAGAGHSRKRRSTLQFQPTDGTAAAARELQQCFCPLPLL
jgi:hypothetical protein